LKKYIYFFSRFPQNIERKNKWLEAINLKNYIPRKQAAVCSAHFREDDYEPKYLFRKLKKDAVPYVCIISKKLSLYVLYNTVISNNLLYSCLKNNQRIKKQNVLKKV